ncbi:MAG: hypothetical protein ACT4PY_09730 [Armatimonadota bacterium]
MNRTVAILVVLAQLTVSCASYTSQLATLPRIASAAAAAEDQGLSVGVNPYLDPEKSARVFGADLKQAGILPLQVIVQNRSAQRLVVRKADFVLRRAEGQEYSPAPASAVAERLESYAGVVGWTIAFGLMGYLLSSSQQREANAARQADFRSKEFQDTPLAPQESAHGFLFYVIPDDVKDMEQATLIAKALDAADGTGMSVMLPLPGMAAWRERRPPDTR